MEIKQKKRDEIPIEYKWKLEDLYPTEADWRKDIEAIKSQIEILEKFQGKLTTGDALANCLNTLFKASEIISRIYVYANLKLHEDTSISASQAMADTAESTSTKFSAAVSFITPEILTHDENTIRNFITTTPELKMYEHYLEDIIRQKAHVLSAEVEAILANAAEVGSAAENIYDMLGSADMKFGTITDENGNTVEITHGRYISLMQSPDRRVRKDAFETYYESFWKLKNALATMLSSSVKKDIFFAKTRKYEGTLSAELSGDNIPRSVYDQLIETVHQFLPSMHRYVALRKKALRLDELHMYDIYTPLAKEADIKMSYADAKKTVAEGLKPLGKNYITEMEKGMNDRWIDVYENEGKQSGAYAWGAFGGHPYVLLNHNDTIGDMFTLAHEMGHAMHSYYSWQTQPKVYASYTIFLAEIASTVNETLVIDHMLKTTTDQNVRTYLLGEYLEQFRGTIFRQTMFAEFEMIIHHMAENGEPLTLESLNKVYRDLNIKYYGPDMIIDEQIDFEWARIPHFYSSFYVYKYATGYSAAIAFNKRLQSGDPKVLEDYINFLKAGSSDYSIEILKKAGIDMNSPAPVHEALTVFDNLVTEMEKALGF